MTAITVTLEKIQLELRSLNQLIERPVQMVAIDLHQGWSGCNMLRVMLSLGWTIGMVIILLQRDTR